MPYKVGQGTSHTLYAYTVFRRVKHLYDMAAHGLDVIQLLLRLLILHILCPFKVASCMAVDGRRPKQTFQRPWKKLFVVAEVLWSWGLQISM